MVEWNHRNAYLYNDSVRPIELGGRCFFYMQEDLQNLQALLGALRKDHLGKEEFLKEF